MLKVIAEDFIKNEYLEVVAPMYAELVAATKKEPGCVEYNLFVDEDDETHFIFIEEWINHQALDAHCASEHFTRLVPLINQYQYKEGTALLMKSF
ncbi:antibiotic biosynthesis monooxygenase [Alkaliphilus sp. MSJ-5]|uniref:Antibiotic biosynthesis monooxygenase n=1 Tax=Alkaliphilus flagellatus TaxID=2841507 RepID=A0ABS6FYJ2_9FIRM|nr:putative quinol monooxygenase [Alkaliphilus flagellatus]MBU5675305.1 antibiotic biosynthesis monooxygenase [Alkaliphilus flagellatus]